MASGGDGDAHAPAFDFNFGGHINWFPGHMQKTKRLLREQLSHIDGVIEVRDARVPYSTCNPELDEVLGDRARVVVMNKADLANPNLRQRITAHHAPTPVVFCNAHKPAQVRAVVPAAIAAVRRSGRSERVHTRLVVCGFPNVGKSTLINAAASLARDAKGGKARTGGRPGVTRHVSAFQVSANPHIMLVDTPGVMVPRVESAEVGLRLALCDIIKESVLGRDVLADFLLYTLNMSRMRDAYARKLHMPAPTRDLDDFLTAVGRTIGARGAGSRDRCAKEALRLFRTGFFGPAVLDPLTTAGGPLVARVDSASDSE